MKFKLKSDAIFEADDLDDAFAKLALHFVKLLNQEDENEELFEPDSEIDLRKLEDTTS